MRKQFGPEDLELSSRNCKSAVNTRTQSETGQHFLQPAEVKMKDEIEVAVAEQLLFQRSK